MLHFPKQVALAATLVLLVACQRQAPVPAEATIVDVPANVEQGGALSGGTPVAPVAAPKVDPLQGNTWPDVALVSGTAAIGCGADSTDAQVDRPLPDLGHDSVSAAVAPCKADGVVRLIYHGKIATDFTALVERVATIAERLKIERRILDLDSSGGHVEDAMKAGDAIGASRWMIRVRENAICHSACVLILAAGDDRRVEGKVGIHRMIRIDSTATSRAELSQELREVYGQMKDYLERNGASVAVADLMMTVPNRKLRLLTPEELLEYGLDGANAVQDDLERIQLTRKCGDDFVRRKDEFTRVFDRRCQLPDASPEAIDACGLALRNDFGFPDGKCPIESPLSAHDDAQAMDGAGSE